MDLKKFDYTSADWRKIIRMNTYKTYFVIAAFIVIYALVGFIVDLYLQSSHYPTASLSQIAAALIHFNLFPIATVLFGLIALVSILITFFWHDRLVLLGTDYHEITPSTARTLQETQLYHVVEEMKLAASLPFMPKVYLINADYMNAFATGFSGKSAMVAITKGLMEKLTRPELQAVMAHELSHIRHLDIKLTLMATVLANITLIGIDLLFRWSLFSNGRDRGDSKARNKLAFIILLLRFTLPLITAVLILFLSRTREYMADAGCVELMRDNGPLASALLKIYNDHRQNTDRYTADYQQTPHEFMRRNAYIFDPQQAGIAVSDLGGLTDIFSTHPNIVKRLEALGFKDSALRRPPDR